MSARITTCPNVDQYVGVSTTIRPVTHTADVAVNSASAKEARSGPAVAALPVRSRVPTPITDANDAAMSSPGRRRTLPCGRCR